MKVCDTKIGKKFKINKRTNKKISKYKGTEVNFEQSWSWSYTLYSDQNLKKKILIFFQMKKFDTSLDDLAEKQKKSLDEVEELVGLCLIKKAHKNYFIFILIRFL